LPAMHSRQLVKVVVRPDMTVKERDVVLDTKGAGDLL
jgi:hypothetical protein